MHSTIANHSALSLDPNEHPKKEKILNWEGKKVSVLGLGQSGQATAKLAHQMKAKVFLFDHKLEKDFSKDLLEDFRDQGFHLSLGSLSPEVLESSDAIILSPGFPTHHPDLKSIPREKMIGEVEFSYQVFIQGLSQRGIARDQLKIIGVTGTNGKTTTTSLIAHLLRENGEKVWLGGNIGNPFAKIALKSIDKNQPDSYFDQLKIILELSSFQLELVNHFLVDIAVILNIVPDHMDRYENFSDYLRAKANLFQNMIEGSPSFLFFNSEDSSTDQLVQLASQKGIKVQYFDQEQDLELKQEDPQFPGKHNQENRLAALAVLRSLKYSNSQLKKAVLTFLPIPHRLEWLGDFQGIHFYNDSKATNIHSTLAGLHALNEKILWIAGGYEANEDFSPLREALSNGIVNQLKQVFLLGPSAISLRKVLNDFPQLEVQRCNSLGEALALAYAQALPQDRILFSPASKSFDRYKNYEERGEHFRRLVQKIKG